ncbi:hypothetical protein Sps_03962 [Shewanella psychrophila]|uniref:Uncharacterized protein n=1 Tax=Shewanella psychrophila TaxID=225848 RepID=A0A1S6HU32_9GAMM|nr:hypothetical protein [Shewanella psychrophila]AQS39077.1 hypothetical protein Sps_03962 [Shewanella psychrophila]
MKNLFKIATISALVALSANAMAEDANQDFTWTGTVPAASAGAGIKIIATGSSTALDAGQFTLTKTADRNSATGYFDITSASTLSFDVVTDDASEDHVDYYYTMTNFTYTNSSNTYPVSGDGFFSSVDLTADGAPLQQDKKTTTAATTSTTLSLTGNKLFTYDEEYVFQATMLITDQAI